MLRHLLWRLRPRGRPLRSVALILLILFGGAGVFQYTQHVTYFTALYWTITTVSTVGYGDVLPTTPDSRIVAMVVMVLAVPVLGLLLADTASTLVEGRLRSVLGLAAHRMPNGFMIVLGWSPPAQVAVSDLLAQGRRVLVVADVDTLGLEHANLTFLHDDPASEATLARVQPQRAGAAILCHDHDGDILVAALSLHRMAPNLPLSAIPARANTASALLELGLLASFPSDDLMGHVLSRAAEAPHAGALLWHLVRDESHRIVETRPEPAEVGQSLASARAERAMRGELLLGALDNGNVRFTSESLQLTGDTRLLLLRRSG